ncbi:MAG: hypothetical protein KKH12_09600 [Gammaproteobacteria bacterium]|nr:hypothetical protein [Gammaproteobacteria bacterium]MBU1481919.1 hypothetical protein [Gammaproteobacteria bacterium]
MKTFSCLPLLCCLICGGAFAESTMTTDTSDTAPDKSTLEAALSACASSVAKDSNGYADQTAMDSCMTKKGFTRPGAPPPGQGRKPPP